MLNQVILVGRLTKDIEVVESENGKKYAQMNLAIPRSFKNADGVYDTDFINAVAFESIAQNTSEYCKKGDIVGVKGRLQSNSFEKEDGSMEYKMDIVAEKVTFLSSNKEKNHDDLEKYKLKKESRKWLLIIIKREEK